MYYFVAAIFVAGFALIYRIIHSPFGQVLKAVRENEPRAISLGYKTDQYKVIAFVLSAALAALAGGTKAIVFQLASLTDVHWGMSRAIAERFVKEGARVAIADVKGAEQTAEALGANAMGVSMDVTNEKQVDEGIAQVAARFSGVDVLVSNAGVQHISALVDLQLSDWRRMLAIHLDGAFLTTRACMRRMRDQRRGGAIIYMGSV